MDPIKGSNMATDGILTHVKQDLLDLKYFLGDIGVEEERV